MDNSDATLKHRPFGRLECLKDKTISSSLDPCKHPASEQDTVTDQENEKEAFLNAMRDVVPVSDHKYLKKECVVTPKVSRGTDNPESDVIAQLEQLVKKGDGFIISNTPEYMEGTGRDIPLEYAERLHRGDFSIQAHIDLHGMGVVQAKDAVEKFLRGAITSGKRAVLIVHGRGLSSPGEPVLKNKVKEWLTRSHWRKWVIAFTSAQSYDGGAGATYILLRHRRQPKKIQDHSINN
jgi:DNA-nicking Smr family endonuclease